MKVEYSKRATADLHKVSADSRAFGEMVAAAVEVRIREVIAQTREHPEGRPPVIGRPGVHVAALVRYPYKIFYRVLEDRVRVLHIRHTSRQVWEAEQ
jgi:plasmid stabilization system protein ParE